MDPLEFQTSDDKAENESPPLLVRPLSPVRPLIPLRDLEQIERLGEFLSAAQSHEDAFQVI
jgi:hypothetical protein